MRRTLAEFYFPLNGARVDVEEAPVDQPDVSVIHGGDFGTHPRARSKNDLEFPQAVPRPYWQRSDTLSCRRFDALQLKVRPGRADAVSGLINPLAAGSSRASLVLRGCDGTARLTQGRPM